MITSGIRLRSQTTTTKNFKLKKFQIVSDLITKTIKRLAENPDDNSKTEDKVRKEVITLCSNFPIYKHLG
jgi:Glycine/serine hydroxymethyltransferase